MVYHENLVKKNRNTMICERANDGDLFSDIARDFGITRERVRAIVKRDSGKTAKELVQDRKVKIFLFMCNFCGHEFSSLNRRGRKFCSKKCRKSFLLKNMEVDGGDRWNFIVKGNLRPFKKYKLINTYTNGKHTTHYEHRIVMEKFLGRKLKRTEHVHHIYGNGLNNNIDNLRIMSSKEHAKLSIRKSLVPVHKLKKTKYIGENYVKRKDLTALG